MNKVDLTKSVAKKFELSKAKSDKIIKHILEAITDSLSKNKSVVLVGFGTFVVRKRAEKKGRNPRTGEPIKIAARKIVRFSVGKGLKLAVNKK
jgi:DNA-binding protein HU-beta